MSLQTLLIAMLCIANVHKLDALTGTGTLTGTGHATPVRHKEHATAEATIGGDSEVTIKMVSGLQVPPHPKLAAPHPIMTGGGEWLPAVKTQKVELHDRALVGRSSKAELATKITMPPAPSLTVGGGLILLAGLVGAGVAAIIRKFSRDKDGAANDPQEVSIEKKTFLPPAPAQPSTIKVMFFISMHVAAGSLLPIVNKYALNEFHPAATVRGTAVSATSGYVWTLMATQFIIAGLVTRAAGACGFCSVTPLQPWKAAAFFPAASMFMVTMVAGNAVMNYSTVNAFLVLRSMVPLPCALAETLIYREARPPIKSAIGLLVILAGSVGYGMSVGHMTITCLPWAVIYLLIMPIDGLLIKHCISTLDITPWGLVYYNNVLAAIPAMFMMYLFEVPTGSALWTMAQVAASKQARCAILLSCCVGLLLSYFQLRTRYIVSATGFVVLGVFEKFLAIAVNNTLVERQGMLAMCFVVVTLSGAILWQLAMRARSIMIREGNPLSDRSLVLPVALACSALMAAAYIEWCQVVA